MWPDNETTLDLINIEYFVSEIAHTVLNRQLLPITVGVYGGWGQGKSSLIKMVQRELEAHEDVVCVSFNGWLFEGYDDAKSALMETILDAIQAKRSLPQKAQAQFKEMLRRVNVLRVASWVPKAGLAYMTGGLSLAGEAAGALTGGEGKGPPLRPAVEEGPARSIRGFREEFQKLLELCGIRTLVVFVDELDRCMPSAVVETLEAMRLFLFVDRTAFVIGADEGVIQQAVAERFSNHADGREFGRRYLEKMIQVPFRLPPMSEPEMKTFMSLLLIQQKLDAEAFGDFLTSVRAGARGKYGEVVVESTITQELLGPEYEAKGVAEAFTLTAHFGGVLSRSLGGNPRQLKRFLNTLFLRERLAAARGLTLKRQVLAKMMVLERFHPNAFEKVVGWCFDHEGTGARLEALEKAASHGAGEKVDDQESVEVPESWVQEALESEGLLQWVRMAPALAGEDLSPYVYLFLDAARRGGVSFQALGPDGVDVVDLLSAPGKTNKEKGVAKLRGLPEPEARRVLTVLTDRIEENEGSLRAQDPPLASLIVFAQGRNDLQSEVIRFLRATAPARLPSGLVPAVTDEALFADGVQASLTGLLTHWQSAKEENSKLATAAEHALKKRGG